LIRLIWVIKQNTNKEQEESIFKKISKIITEAKKRVKQASMKERE
jgi:hypothetical protein